MIGYYVHHQGHGHLMRMRAIADHLTSPVTVLSSVERPEDWTGDWLHLPIDTSTQVTTTSDVTAGDTLHWAPLQEPGLRDGMAEVARWVNETQPRLVVVDVSVEIAVFVRAMGVPVVVMAMPGDRQDRAHATAYDLASRIIAPFPHEARDQRWPARWTAKTVHVGGVSRHDGRPRVPVQPRSVLRVAVLGGTGGSDIGGRQLDEAQRATAGWDWELLGVPGGRWYDDPWPQVCDADVVITHAGQGAIAAVAAAERPAVVIPAERPFGEQVATARNLRTLGCATVLDAWPPGDQWPAILARTAARDGRAWRTWSSGDGARRAAVAIDQLAGT